MNRLLLTSLLLATGACHMSAESKDRDPGPATDRSFEVGSFDRIEIAGPYEVNVSTGGATRVSARGGSALLDETDVKVEGGKLIIAPKKQKGVRWTWRQGKAVFAVSTAQLKAAGIAGSGSIVVDKVAGDFSGDVAGSGDLRLAAVNGGATKLAIAGSGKAIATGSADSLKVDIAGSGDVDAKQLSARTADISIAGSGNVNANATETSKVSIIGSGNVDIGGGGKCSVSKTGSGNVNCH